MTACVLCGSPSVWWGSIILDLIKSNYRGICNSLTWPDGQSSQLSKMALEHFDIPGSVNETPLCEHHLSLALSTSIRPIFTEESQSEARVWNDQANQLWDLIEEWASWPDDNQMDPPSHEYRVRDQIISKVFESVDKKEPRLLGFWCAESEFDRWLCLRIQDYARRGDSGEPTYRCCAKIASAKDGRCTNHAHSKGGLCVKCRRQGRDKVDHDSFSEKLEKCLEIMKHGDGSIRKAS